MCHLPPGRRGAGGGLASSWGGGARGEEEGVLPPRRGRAEGARVARVTAEQQHPRGSPSAVAGVMECTAVSTAGGQPREPSCFPGTPTRRRPGGLSGGPRCNPAELRPRGTPGAAVSPETPAQAAPCVQLACGFGGPGIWGAVGAPLQDGTGWRPRLAARGPGGRGRGAAKPDSAPWNILVITMK